MAAVQVNVHEAKSQLSALIAKVLAGEQVTIARAGEPVVDLVVHRGPEVVTGLGKGAYDHDASIFDGEDRDLQDLFYGADAR